VKDLNKLGRDLQKVIIVDNSPASYIFHPDNAVSIHVLKDRITILHPATPLHSFYVMCILFVLKHSVSYRQAVYYMDICHILPALFEYVLYRCKYNKGWQLCTSFKAVVEPEWSFIENVVEHRICVAHTCFLVFTIVVIQIMILWVMTL
jgi:hypothetical protein